MITPNILEYITAQRAAGHSEEAVRTALTASGWQAADIDDALSKAPQPPATPAAPTLPAMPTPPKTEKPKKRLFPWELLLIALIILAMIGGGVWYYFSQPASTSTATQTSPNPS